MNNQINIVDGTGTGSLIEKTYSVSVSSPGYDNETIDPSSITYTGSESSFDLTIAANGTLTLHVSETGTSSGTAVVGATFIRTDASGNEYGTVITSDSSGNAVFNNVPYALSGAPNIYFKQTASDGNHSFSTSVINTTLTDSTGTFEITNLPPQEVTFNLTDANYSDLPIGAATLTLS